MPDIIPAGLEETRDINLEVPPEQWREIPIHSDLSKQAKTSAFRLNALGSLFYFSKHVLGHTRLSPILHKLMCQGLEKDVLREVQEWPRDHFKTTIASVSCSMWWGLPFTHEDEDLMSMLEFSPRWIAWMKRAHNTSTRTLIASEVIGNARKIGTKIDGHYKSNSVFRFLFPSIIPKDFNRGWNQDSMTHNRLDGIYHGEGTYDFIGVKGALQSRHYDRVIEDDLVGEKAINSDLVMESTIEWHRKLPGAFDSDPSRPNSLGDQLVIGNRWSHRDLNSWIRANEPAYTFHTHAADGGCCGLHPAGIPIFPEEYTLEKLHAIRQTEGAYNYSAQYRNNPIAPEAVRFKDSWLRHFQSDVWTPPSQQSKIVNWQQLSDKSKQAINRGNIEDVAESQGATPRRLQMALRHEVKQGEVIDDIRAGELDRVCLMDPNHSGEHGRARNAILVVGIYNRPPAPRRIYLLDCWAQASSHDAWIEAALSTKAGLRGLAVKWRCHYLYIESEVAGQQGWKFYIRERMKRMGTDGSFTIRPLKTDRSANAKNTRIIGMESIYENGFFWVPRVGCELWKDEYSQYPNGSTVDLLDLTGYLPQTWGPGSRQTARDWMQEELRRKQSAIGSVGKAGY